ncbi:MAG: pantoate--beta-alanine ligase [Dysgonamonadaceae bacterium]|nr:pantoate--beta-alanine ligase [Dysgonamonadaceae bacterium]
MITIMTVSELTKAVKDAKNKNLTIGLVPTMGYLHEGHASLIRQSAVDNGLTVVSCFVNPTQFAPGEDFESYPRDFTRDRKVAEKAGATVLFAPDVSEMYPENYNTFVLACGVSEVLEGLARPTHFRGVTTVLAKLFNLSRADRAYFGQKDAQQVSVVEQMVRDLNFNTAIIRMPIVREDSGLAKSSRNQYLSDTELQEATVLKKSLDLAHDLIRSGEIAAGKIKAAMTEFITQTAENARIDRIDIVDNTTLADVETITSTVLIPVAVYIGKTRLIDNIVVPV